MQIRWVINDAVLYCNIGSLFSKEENYKLAIVYFNKSLNTNPNFAEVYYNLAIVHEKQGNQKLAEDFKKKAHSLGLESK